MAIDNEDDSESDSRDISIVSCITGETNFVASSPVYKQAAKCKWRALRHTCLLLLSVLGGMPASHQGMQARLFFVVDI